jgi:hypothetical protein
VTAKIRVLVKVVTAPQDWKCDRCGAVIKQGEQCIKIGGSIICSRHVNDKQKEG